MSNKKFTQDNSAMNNSSCELATEEKQTTISVSTTKKPEGLLRLNIEKNYEELDLFVNTLVSEIADDIKDRRASTSDIYFFRTYHSIEFSEISDRKVALQIYPSSSTIDKFNEILSYLFYEKEYDENYCNYLEHKLAEKNICLTFFCSSVHYDEYIFDQATAELNYGGEDITFHTSFKNSIAEKVVEKISLKKKHLRVIPLSNVIKYYLPPEELVIFNCEEQLKVFVKDLKYYIEKASRDNLDKIFCTTEYLYKPRAFYPRFRYFSDTSWGKSEIEHYRDNDIIFHTSFRNSIVKKNDYLPHVNSSNGARLISAHYFSADFISDITNILNCEDVATRVHYQTFFNNLLVENKLDVKFNFVEKRGKYFCKCFSVRMPSLFETTRTTEGVEPIEFIKNKFSIATISSTAIAETSHEITTASDMREKIICDTISMLNEELLKYGKLRQSSGFYFKPKFSLGFKSSTLYIYEDYFSKTPVRKTKIEVWRFHSFVNFTNHNDNPNPEYYKNLIEKTAATYNLQISLDMNNEAFVVNII